MDLGAVGLWTYSLRGAEGGALDDVLAELEELGYGTVWFPGGVGDAAAAFDLARTLLEHSSQLAIATGILSIWAETAASVAERHRELRRDHPNRFLLGLGVSHGELVDRAEPGRYQKPWSAAVAFLDDLDAADPDGLRTERAFAALGPRMLQLAADRTWGAHPYFVPVEHTAFARSTVGAGPLLAPEQAVVLETDPERARTLARGHMQLYLQLRNYTNNLRRFGFGDDDIEGGGSDRLVDAIVAWGDAGTVAERIRAHHSAGADHVCVQVITDQPGIPMPAWRALAEALRD